MMFSHGANVSTMKQNFQTCLTMKKMNKFTDRQKKYFLITSMSHMGKLFNPSLYPKILTVFASELFGCNFNFHLWATTILPAGSRYREIGITAFSPISASKIQ